jgi:hypothetical protein
MFKKKEYNPLKKDPFTDATDAGVSTESIVSSRTFGVELEVYGGNVSKLCDYVVHNGHTYGHDGSIKNEKGNNDGAIEVQTSILSGRIGVDSLRKLMNTTKELGFLVNGTCGTHVHLGGGDFFDKSEFKIGSLKDLKGEQTNILFEKKLLALMIEAYGDFKYVVDKVIGDMSYNLGKTYTNEYRMSNDKYSRFCVIPINYFGNTQYIVARESTLTKMGTSQKEAWKNEHVNLTDKPSKLNFLPKDVVLVYKTETDKFKKLKKLFYFYTVFNDVLFKMLPYERRSNNFCKKLSSTYSIKEIQKCQSQGELEKVWYQKETYADIERDKRSTLQGNSGDSRNRDSSVRYHSINFHSLYYKHGTVEIRMHHGTLNAESLLLWIQLHQKIMDGISNNEVNDAIIAKASKGYDDAYDGALLLIEALRLEGTNLETFIKHRIKKYN